MYVLRNIAAGSRNHRYYGKSILHFLCIADIHKSCQQYNKYGKCCYGKTTMHSIVALHMSRPTTLNTLRSSCEVPDILSDCK